MEQRCGVTWTRGVVESNCRLAKGLLPVTWVAGSNGGSAAVYSAGPPMAASRGTYSQLGWAAGRGDPVAGPNRLAKC